MGVKFHGLLSLMGTKMIEGRVRGHQDFVEGADLNPTANKKGCKTVLNPLAWARTDFYQRLFVAV